MTADASLSEAPLSDAQRQRRSALALLARASRNELAEAIHSGWPSLEVRSLRKPEIGLVMLRGRIGGDGRPFNTGEATVARAVVELASGERGYGQVLGRDTRRAELAAIADALWQNDAARPLIETSLLAPVRKRLAAEAAQSKSETAATRVDFFTLVRGEG